MTETAAIIASVILSCLAVFQILLISGKPIGRFAWGGQYTVLPPRLRIASAFSIGLYAAFALVILNQGGAIFILNKDGWMTIALNTITGYFFIGIIMNVISHSKSERLIMTPVATALALLFLYVALKT